VRYPLSMPRHESITDEYLAQLNAGFLEAAKRVKTASGWPETQKRIVFGTYGHLTALNRVEEGWTREAIEDELRLRTGFGTLPNPVRVIGNRDIEEVEPS
jgi:hypothetical protein